MQLGYLTLLNTIDWLDLSLRNNLVVCIQETHLKKSETKEVFQGIVFHATATTRAKGVMIGISKKIPWVLEQCIEDEGEDRYIILKDTESCSNIPGVCLCPQWYLINFWSEIYYQIGDYHRGLMLFGDFNFVVDPCIDRRDPQTHLLCLPSSRAYERIKPEGHLARQTSWRARLHILLCTSAVIF